MAKELNVGTPLPLDIVTQRIGIIGQTGVGKTHLTTVMTEEMIETGVPVACLDPKGDMWGLRTSRNGKSAGYPVVICGGDHQDVPLEPTSGRVIADWIIADRVACVLDMSNMRKNEQRRFATDFAEELYHKNREPLHLVVDEADMFAPQRALPGFERMLGAFEDLVRRGRSRGIGVTLATQRPAVLHKDVLTQVSLLVALRLSGPQDRNALHLHRFAAHRYRLILEPRRAAAAEEGEGPAAQDLRQQRHAPRRGPTQNHQEDGRGRPQEPLRAHRRHHRASQSRGPETPQAANHGARTRAREGPRAETPRGRPPTNRRRLIVTRNFSFSKTFRRQRADPKTVREWSANGPRLVREWSRKNRESRESSRDTRESRESYRTGVSGRRQGALGDSGLRRILIALAQRPQGLNKRQLGVRAQLSTKSGTYSNYLSEGRKRGWLVGSPSKFKITDAGLEALGEYVPLPTGPALQEYWKTQLGPASGAARMLDILCEVHPESISAAELAERAEMSTSGTFSNYPQQAPHSGARRGLAK